MARYHDCLKSKLCAELCGKRDDSNCRNTDSEERFYHKVANTFRQIGILFFSPAGIEFVHLLDYDAEEFLE